MLAPCLVVVASSLLWADAAAAAAPGEWSVAVERLFGISRVSIDSDFGDETYTSISLLSNVSGSVGYSAPRLAFDYFLPSSISFGGALGYQSLGDGPDGDAWLLAPRLGYFARPGRSFGLWPRVGLTVLVLDRDGDDDTATALTLELPLEFLLSRGAAFTLTPHADIGLGGSRGDADRTITEIGLQFGMGLFF